jgi:hypothetical protein
MSIIPILEHCINRFGNNSINVIEIGARYGESTKLLLKYLNIRNYYIIDPYCSYDEYEHDGFNDIIKGKDDEIFNKVKNELQIYTTYVNKNTNLIFNRTFSNNEETIQSIKNESIDLIFIDGNHSYKYVLEDLENYYPKLVKNGILCGDDFFMRLKKNDILNSGAGYDEPMVFEAVIEFCKKYNKGYTEFGKHREYGKIFMINELFI